MDEYRVEKYSYGRVPGTKYQYSSTATKKYQVLSTGTEVQLREI
eukprot:SAG11_NODE_1215_length_5501_cov_4.190820_9_plen_44_part_00